MEYLPLIATVAIAHFLALISPGPDLFLVMRNSLVQSRKVGFWTAMGIAAGIAVHVAYSLAGIAIIISRSILLFSIIKFIGAGYLIYIGYKSLRAKRSNIAAGDQTSQELSVLQALWMGFITNVTNPKATLFFLSILTVIVSPTTPIQIQLVMGAEMVVVTGLWFSLLALAFSHASLRQKMGGIQYYAEKVFGVVLIALGIKLATITSR